MNDLTTCLRRVLDRPEAAFEQETPKPGKTGTHARGNVLVVDDDHSMRAVLRRLLENEGFHVTCAGNGREALETLRAESPRPALILLDMMMPVMNGHQFVDELKLDPEIAHIPIVVMTADGHWTVTDETVTFLPKPFEVGALMKVIDQTV